MEHGKHEMPASHKSMPKDVHMEAMKHINEKGCDGLHAVVSKGPTANAQASRGKKV
jgi:hypothetical protein